MSDIMTPGEIAENDQKVASMQIRLHEVVEGLRLHKEAGCPHFVCLGKEAMSFVQEEAQSTPMGWLIVALAMLSQATREDPLTLLESEFTDE